MSTIYSVTQLNNEIKELLDTVPGMRDELRRPMMLILSAVRKQA